MSDLVKRLRAMPFDKTSVAGVAFTEAADRIERLEEALRYALWQHEGNGTPLHQHWAAKAYAALQDDKQ